MEMVCGDMPPPRYFTLSWKRKKNPADTTGPERLYKFSLSDVGEINIKPFTDEIASKFKYVFYNDTTHILKLLAAEKNDEGFYFCYGHEEITQTTFLSPPTKLDVGKCCQHVVYIFAIYVNVVYA